MVILSNLVIGPARHERTPARPAPPSREAESPANKRTGGAVVPPSREEKALSQNPLVQLSASTWALGAILGSGGFAQVYEATRDDGFTGALKYVRKEPGAERELLLAELPPSPHVVPVLDIGEDANHYILAMPRCDQSLRAYLDGNPRPTQGDAVAIMRDVSRGLVAIEGHVVHRDLKPENVLLLEGRWCLTDFGISRYADASTSADTRKFSLSPAYAAPEQWRHEHSVPAADVYAFGVMAFELLSGGRPFSGPSAGDYRNQHLSDVPAPLGSPPALAALVAQCLGKAAGARPEAANILKRLERSAATPTTAGRLAAANAALVQDQADTATCSLKQSMPS